MKTLVIILVFGFTWQVSNAYISPANRDACLIENGLTADDPDLRRLEAIGHPEHADRLKDISKDKMISSIACMIQKQHEDENLIDILKDLILIDDKATEEEKKKMLETLIICNTNAAGDNTKLLSCLNIIAPPFDYPIAAILELLDSVDPCNPKCHITIGEMYKLKQKILKIEWLLEIINEQKLGCLMACKIDEEMKSRPHRVTFWEAITNRINKSEKLDENQKKEMLETVNRCKAQVTELKDKNYEMVKCVNMFKPPFANLYFDNEAKSK